MPDPLRVPDAARAEAACRIARAIERTMRDLTDACPWPQRGFCALDHADALALATKAVFLLSEEAACV